MNVQERAAVGNRISKVTIAWNIALFLVKLFAGVLGRSSAMLADAVHSLSDVLITILVLIGLHMAKKPADDEHPYGHEKMEPVIAKVLAFILIFTALFIGCSGIQKIRAGSYAMPGAIGLYAAILSIAVKEWMYRYTLRGSKKIESAALLADAWHHRSDAFSSIGVLLGIGGARLGYEILEPIASLLICVLIIKVSINIYIHSVNQLIDRAGDRGTVEKIEAEIMKVEGVIRINKLKTRVHASKLFVDLEVAVAATLSVKEGHDIAQEINDRVEGADFRVKHCMVHIDPF